MTEQQDWRFALGTGGAADPAPRTKARFEDGSVVALAM
jgi:hypothetical protein